MLKIPLLVALFFVASGLFPQVKGDGCYKSLLVTKIKLTCPEEAEYCCEKIGTEDEECCNLQAKMLNWLEINQQIVIIVAAIVSVIFLVMLIVSIIKCCCCC